MNRFLLTVLFFWQTLFLVGQTNKGITDSVFQIREITVSSNRLEYFSVGNKTRTLDSSLLASYASTNLAQVLSSYSQVQINSYGLGLSNASLRGTGTSHAAVIWNGFNLQDLLNGGVDCSLLPSNFFDDVKVQFGGCSALYGSGAIGGAIHLNNSLNFEKGFTTSATVGYGSYENMFGGLNLGFSNNVYSGFVRSFYNTAQNNFPFKLSSSPDSPTKTMINAERRQYGVLSGNAFKLGPHSKMDSYFWFQDNDKNIAPTILTFGNGNRDNQRDKFYRATASWKTWSEYADFTLRSSFSNYYMTYDTSHYNSIQSSNQAEYNLKLSANHLLNAGIDYTYEKGISRSLMSDAHRHRISLFTSYRFTGDNSKLQAVVNFRDEIINQDITPFTYSIGLEYQIHQKLRLKGLVSKNYRVPAFNDLYWIPGGNPNLRNESGFNQEMGLIFSTKCNHIGIHYELTGFNNLVSDWILWQPSLTNANLWTPENVSKVWARGVENDLSFTIPLNNLLIKATASYTYTRSTKEKADSPNDVTYRKQLIYEPEHKGLTSLSARYYGYTLYFAQSFTGLRYSLQDNTKSVDPYTIGNLSLSKIFNYHSFQINVCFQVNNLWNSVYQVMPYYPTPLRNFQINIQCKL